MTAPAYSGIMIPQPGESLQRMRRVYREFTDQHGRRFGAQADSVSNQPIGEFTPVDFEPKWLPPMRFAKFRRDGDLTFSWAYQDMADELGEMTARYYDEATKLSLQLPGDIPSPEPGGVVDRRLRALLGPPPLSPALPLACQAGDRWLLGDPDAEPSEELKQIVQQGLSVGASETLQRIKERIEAQITKPLPTVHRPEPVVEAKPRTIADPTPLANIDPRAITYTEFVKECKGRNMRMPDIVAAWNEHKANLAAEATEEVREAEAAA